MSLMFLWGMEFGFGFCCAIFITDGVTKGIEWCMRRCRARKGGNQ